MTRVAWNERRGGWGWSVVLLLLLAVGAGSGCSGASRQEIRKQAELHYQLGDGAFRDHNIPLAIKELLETLRLEPEHADAQHLLGFIYMGRQEYDQAASCFRRAVELRPDFLEARNNLGASYLALCQWKDAEEVFTGLIAEPVYQTPYIARNNLGLSLYHQGRFREALPHFQKAVFLNTSFCVGFNNMGMTLIELGEAEEAERALFQSLKADASCKKLYPEPHFHLGRLYERLGRREQAAAEYNLCREQTQGGPVTSYGCGGTPLGLRCEQKLKQLELR